MCWAADLPGRSGQCPCSICRWFYKQWWAARSAQPAGTFPGPGTPCWDPGSAHWHHSGGTPERPLTWVGCARSTSYYWVIYPRAGPAAMPVGMPSLATLTHTVCVAHHSCIHTLLISTACTGRLLPSMPFRSAGHWGYELQLICDWGFGRCPSHDCWPRTGAPSSSCSKQTTIKAHISIHDSAYI